MGLNSQLSIDTAKRGRRRPRQDDHRPALLRGRVLADPSKALSLLNAVADEPDTYIIIESTANGANFFKARWDRAVRGEGDFQPVFIGWTEDPDCTKAFPSAEQREAFIATIGKGPWGKDEPRLIEKFGCTPEQLYWRRTRSSTSARASSSCSSRSTRARRRRRSSGRASTSSRSSSSEVRSTARRRSRRCRRRGRARRVRSRAAAAGGRQDAPAGVRDDRGADGGDVDAARGHGLRADHPFWTVWEHAVARRRGCRGGSAVSSAVSRRPTSPRRARGPTRSPGQYIVAVDPAGGDENTAGEEAFHAIEVIDHRTGEQVAEYASREDPDIIALQALLAGLYFNEAWISVEATGGWGLAPLRKLWKDFGYRRVYTRKALDGVKEPRRTGWAGRPTAARSRSWRTRCARCCARARTASGPAAWRSSSRPT
jgi:hypothetical protein